MSIHTHIMLDLETLGTHPGCAILSVAGVPFDPHGHGVDLSNAYYANVDAESCFRAGLGIESDTLQLWLTAASEAARKSLYEPQPVDLVTVCETWDRWIELLSDPADVVLWSHGLSFDVPIWKFARQMCELPSTLDHHNERDTRTLFELAGYDWRSGISDHNAIQDAARQAVAVQDAYRLLEAR